MSSSPQSSIELILRPGRVSLNSLADIYWNGRPARLDPSSDDAITRAASHIAEISAGDAPIYGVNTGFGKLAAIKIPADRLLALQRNLILSHCCGVGAPLQEPIVRLVLALKLISLGRAPGIGHTHRNSPSY